MPQNLHEKIGFEFADPIMNDFHLIKAEDHVDTLPERPQAKEIKVTEVVDTLFNNGLWTKAGDHATHYTPDGVKAPNGKIYFCDNTKFALKKPPTVFYNIFTGFETRDTDEKPYQRITSYFNLLKIAAMIYFNLTNWLYGHKVKNGDSGDEIEEDSFDHYAIKLSEMSLGQEEDIATCNDRFQRWRELEPTHKAIVAGSSRGAASAFNFMCQPALADELKKTVKFGLFEACFWTVDDILPRLPFAPDLVPTAVNTFLYLFTKYRKDGPSPAKNIENYPEGIPAIFVSSLIDHVVQYDSCKRVATELAARGKNDVYFLTLKNSRHPNYTLDDVEDATKYETFMHAIYRKYGCKYVPELADRGEHLLEETCLAKADNNTYRFQP